MKIGIWYEDLAHVWFIQPLVQKRLELATSEFISYNRRGTCIEGVKRGLKEALKDFRYYGCDRIIVTADNHGCASADRARLIREVQEKCDAIPCIVAVAIVEIEAWFLSDFVRFCDAMGSPRLNKPSSVDEIQEPKEFIEKAFKLRPTQDHIKRYVDTMQMDIATQESPSLHRFICALDGWRSSSAR